MIIETAYIYPLLALIIGLDSANIHNSEYLLDGLSCWHQQEAKARITGQVLDDEGMPLPFATVYISNTTIGDITDEKGIYTLEKVPYGQHTLVVSFVGFHSQIKQIHVDQAGLEFNFNLAETEIPIDEVQVTDRRGKNKRKQHYKTFRRYFLGTSAYASECIIENPEVLRFSIDPNSRAMFAIAYDNLVIVNQALGYKIYYLLEQFEVYRDGSSMYLGKPRYEPMEPRNEAEARKWKINRYLAYTGSFRHFLATLVNNDFREQGFFITKVMNAQPNADQVQQVFSSGVLIEPGSRHFERRLAFGYYLFVRFDKEPYYNPNRDQFDNLVYFTQDSWIKMLKPNIIFHTNGYLYDPASLIFFGHWANEKVAEDLPFDFVPESNIF